MKKRYSEYSTNDYFSVKFCLNNLQYTAISGYKNKQWQTTIYCYSHFGAQIAQQFTHSRADAEKWTDEWINSQRVFDDTAE